MSVTLKYVFGLIPGVNKNLDAAAPLSNTLTRRITELDGLRGIAILLVISFHYINNQLVQSQHPAGKVLSLLTSFGWVGVDLFFILSGFLIGSILIRNKGRKNYFSTFYIRRIVRIIPNYYLLLTLFLLLLTIPYFSRNYFLTGNDSVPLWAYFTMVQNFFMASNYDMGNKALSVTWSIGIEEQFYILIPLVVYIVRKSWLPFILVGIIIMASFMRMQYDNWKPAYVLLHCRADSLAIGILISWLNQQVDLNEFVTKYFKHLMALLMVTFGMIGYLFVRYADLGPVKNLLFGIIFGIGLLLALTRQSSWYGALLRNKQLVWVGTISYSLYLFHYIILGVFHHVFANRGGIEIQGGKDVVITLGALIASFAFSWFVYNRLEVPMTKIGKRYSY